MKAVLNTTRVNQYRVDHIRRQRAVEKYFIPKIAAVIVADYKRAISSLKQYGAAYTRNHLHSLVLIEPITNIIKLIYKKSAYVEARYVGSYIKRNRVKKFRTFGTSLEDLAPVIDSYFELYLFNQAVLPISETTKKTIVKHLLDEVDSGKSIDQAIEDFTDYAISYGHRNGYPQESVTRANLIATTETTKALSLGGLFGAFMTGVDVDKLWITCDDERVRDPNHPMYLGQDVPFPHTQLDLQQTELMGSFYNGEYIKFPGDPEASFKNTVRCRCALMYVEKEDGEEDADRDINNFLNELGFGSI